MKKRMKLKKLFVMMFVIIIAFGCKPDTEDFERPDDLVGTVYLQLEELREFTYYLRALEQTPFKESLESGGSWTIFAPTDSAFEAFMMAEGYGSFESIPAERLENIVRYSIIVDAWNTTTLTYSGSQFYEGQSHRRHTQYQDPIVEIQGEDYLHIFEEPLPGKYLLDTSHGRVKTTTYFLESYFTLKAQAAERPLSDYDFMFTGETFNQGDMKVFEANVEQTSISAENGLIYTLDKVIEPRKNLYQNLSSEEYGGKYSTFKKLLERFATLDYAGDEENLDTGEFEPIYRMNFETGVTANLLAYNPNDENYPPLYDATNRTTRNSTGLLAPTNEALQSYLDGSSIIGQLYDSYDDMPLDVLGQFLKPYFFTDFWSINPSHIGSTFDVSLGEVDFQEGHVVDKMYCSNGFFAGVNQVYENDGFASTMGPLLLKPDYTIMLQAIQGLGIDNALQSQGIDFSVFGIKNDQFVDIADPNSATRRITVVNYDPLDLPIVYIQVEGDPEASNNRIYPDPNASTPNATDVAYVETTLQDIVLNQIVDEQVDFNSNNYYLTRSGEFVLASGGALAGGGDIVNGNEVSIESIEETNNGKFYEMSGHLERPLRFTYGALLDSGNFSRFIEILDAAGTLLDISGSDDKLISFLNLEKSFTLLAPNDVAVNQAISDGVIQDPDPSNLSSLSELEFAIAKEEFLDFIEKHFLQQSIPADGRITGLFSSLYFSRVVDFVPVYNQFVVENNKPTSSLTITNVETNESATTNGISNLLSKKVVIHEIDNYIK